MTAPRVQQPQLSTTKRTTKTIYYIMISNYLWTLEQPKVMANEWSTTKQKWQNEKKKKAKD